VATADDDKAVFGLPLVSYWSSLHAAQRLPAGFVDVPPEPETAETGWVWTGS